MALYHSPDYQKSFKSTGYSFQEQKFNIDFPDGGQLGFPIGTFFSYYLHVYFFFSFFFFFFKAMGILLTPLSARLLLNH